MTGTDATSGRGHLVTDERWSRGGRQKTQRGELRGVRGGDPWEKRRGRSRASLKTGSRGRGNRSKAGGAAAPQPRRALSRSDRLGLTPSPCCCILLTERSHAGEEPGCLFSVNEPRVFCQTSPARDCLLPKGILNHLSCFRHF